MVSHQRWTLAVVSAVTRAKPGVAQAFLAAPAQGSNGFTLVELLATMTVLVVLSTLATTQLSLTVSSNRAFTAYSELVASLALARSEAMRRGLPVALSATAPGGINQFGGGWTVWVDTNGNGTFDSGEPVLRTHEAMPASAVTIAGPDTPITYGSMGFLTPAGAINIKVCPQGVVRTGYAIAIQPNGMSDVNSAAPCP